YARQACLMDSNAIEEALDDNNGFPMGRGPVEIEEHKRLPESWRKAIFRIRPVDRSAGVGHKKPILIVNRYDDAAGHEAFSAIISNAEMTGCFRVNTAPGQIRVRGIDVTERKRQRLVVGARSGLMRVLCFLLADGRRTRRRHLEPVLKL